MKSMDTLHRLVQSKPGLKVLTTYNPHWEREYTPQPPGVSLAYLVEVVGNPGDVYAQGFGLTAAEAAAVCLDDWNL